MIKSAPAPQAHAQSSVERSDEISFIDIAIAIKRDVRLLLLLPLISAVLALSVSYLIKPTFTATAQIMPPQQQQSSAAALLGSLGGLAGAAGAAGLKNPADQWVGLLKSRTIADTLIERYKLKQHYEHEFMFETRAKLNGNTKISAGKDSLIDIEVTDVDPKLAAAIANSYIDELQKLSKNLAVSEAAQRRLFFENQLKDAKDNLVKAETTLRSSGVNPSTLKVNPESAVAGIAQLQAQIAAAEVSLTVMRDSMTSDSPTVRQATTELNSLRAQLRKADQIDSSNAQSGGSAYVQKFRDFKYYETLFDLLARQYELAKADEAKDGALIQVVDSALVPEWKSGPKRAQIMVSAFVVSLLLTLFYVLMKPALARLKHASAAA